MHPLEKSYAGVGLFAEQQVDAAGQAETQVDGSVEALLAGAVDFLVLVGEGGIAVFVVGEFFLGACRAGAVVFVVLGRLGLRFVAGGPCLEGGLPAAIADAFGVRLVIPVVQFGTAPVLRRNPCGVDIGAPGIVLRENQRERPRQNQRKGKHSTTHTRIITNWDVKRNFVLKKRTVIRTGKVEKTV